VVSGYNAQAPDPSHRPVVPQLAALPAGQAESGSSAGMKRQRPIQPVCAHETQGPSQVTLQHVPLEQWPEAQSLSAVHVKPLSFMPQLRTAHCCPAAHSALVAQLPSQKLELGSQE
jgi:hypothetical protein